MMSVHIGFKKTNEYVIYRNVERINYFYKTLELFISNANDFNRLRLPLRVIDDFRVVVDL